MGSRRVFFILVLTVLGHRFAECRQMCLSCQYQTGQESGWNCNNDPWNWPNGNVRMRCNFRCTFQIWLDTDVDKITYTHRGCSASNDVLEDECVEDEFRKQVRCYYTCGDVDYCNNWNATDILTSSARSVTSFSSWTVPVHVFGFLGLLFVLV